MKDPFQDSLKIVEELPSIPRWTDVVFSLGDRVICTVTPFDYTEARYPKVEELTQSIQRSVVEDRDSKIIEALSDKGFVFENQKELSHFAETRCRVLREPRLMKKTLMVDESVVICSWCDTFDVDINNDTNKITINAGFEPDKPKSFIGE